MNTARCGMARLLVFVSLGLWGSWGSALGQSPEMLVLGGTTVVRYEYPGSKPIDAFVGYGMSKLNYGWGMTYGPDGMLYVSDQMNSEIYRYHGQTGQYQGVFIPNGSGGQYSPVGMAFHDDHLYICNIHTDRVLRYVAATGAFAGIFIEPGAGSLDGPGSIAFDASGHVWVASSLNDKVLQYDAATGAFLSEVLAPPGKTMDSPIGLLVDSKGNLFISAYASSNIFVIPPGGAIQELVPSGSAGLLKPGHMAFSPEGHLLVANDGNFRVLGFDRATGVLTGKFVSDGNAGFLGPGRAVAFVPQKDACYADCDGTGQLDIDDFVCFQTAYALGC